MSEALRITEIFYSLQGETSFMGLPTVFIRLTGCPLRCQYCDTAYAFYGGKKRSLTAILTEVAQYAPKYVTVTGGEPLAQPNCQSLLTQLCDLGYTVSLETSGALDISRVDQRVVKIVDIKTPDSKEVEKNHWHNLDYILPTDEIKFVLCSRKDYEWAKIILSQCHLTAKCSVLFSPSHGQLSAQDLANWIVADKLPVRFQIQLHKLLWNDQPGF